METRSRLAQLSLLVVVALAGTSLAVAADTDRPTPPMSTSAPAAIYVPRVTDPLLAPIDAAAEDLAWAARDVLSSLQSLDVDAARQAVARGDAAQATLTTQLGTLAPDNPARTSAASLPRTWQMIKTRASIVANVLTDLERHDTAVIQATGYGRQKGWPDALASLEAAAAAMDRARSDRAILGRAEPMGALDDLMLRYDTYDTALSSLYRYLSNGHGQHGKKFGPLHDSVTAAQAALPGGWGVFSTIVGEVAGIALTASLAEISRARADIDALLNPPIAHAQ